jgi:hypothetical protein
MPQGGSNWSERFQDNLVYYFGNYVILTVATLFVLGVLSQQKPFVISLVFFFGLAASLLLVLEDTVNLGSFPVGLKEKCAAITLEWLLGAYITDSFAMWGYCLGLALVSASRDSDGFLLTRTLLKLNFRFTNSGGRPCFPQAAQCPAWSFIDQG